MPRGIKANTNYDAEIQKIDEKISKLTSQIDNLKTERKELLEKKRNSEMKKLYEFIEEKGLNTSQVIELLKSSNTSV